ncbi:MAG: glycosyltransferase family 4 protein [Desulfobacterales bacterium]|nr:glycosyltransferase family 4 protein [Desulfobacterales bacterium]
MKNNHVYEQMKKQPLRVCILSYRSNPHCGGQGVYVKNLSRALRDTGCEVDVLSGPPDPDLDRDIGLTRLPGLDLYNPENPFRIPGLTELKDPASIIEALGVWTGGFPEPLTFGLRAYRHLKTRLHHYDIVHDNQSLSYPLLALSNRVPTITTIHHPMTIDRKMEVRSREWPWQKLKAYRWYSFINMQVRTARRLPGAITVSECSKADIVKDFKLSPDRLEVIPNGIDIARFYPIPAIKREKGHILVTTSADVPLKGLRYLLTAVAMLRKTRDVKLTVVGKLSEKSATGKLIRRLGIGDHVSFTGRITNGSFVKLYARASMAVVPSLYEGFGLPAGEAMACGVPVISTTAGALSEVVGDAGILVPPGDAPALAAAIAGLLDHPEKARFLGRAGVERIHRKFTWRNAALKTLETYHRIIHDYRRLQ